MWGKSVQLPHHLAGSQEALPTSLQASGDIKQMRKELVIVEVATVPGVGCLVDL